MKVMCWNVRGFGSGGKIGAMKDLVLKNQILLFGLVETKSSNLNERLVRSMWEIMIVVGHLLMPKTVVGNPMYLG